MEKELTWAGKERYTLEVADSTNIQAAEYDCYVKLRYYLADGGTMGAATTHIGTSDPLYIPAGECDTIEKTLPK